MSALAEVSALRPDDGRAWLDGLRRGDVGAFDAAYRALRPAVATCLRRLGASPAVAEELAQETMLRLASHARSLHPDSRPRAWAFAVARNLLRDHQRRVLLERDRFARIDLAGLHDARWPSPSEHQEAAEVARRLEAALDALPDLLREAVVLCALEGFEPTVAAAMAGVPAETMRQRLARGRARLQQSLGEAKEVVPTAAPSSEESSSQEPSMRLRRALRDGLSPADRLARARATVVVVFALAQVIWALARAFGVLPS